MSLSRIRASVVAVALAPLLAACGGTAAPAAAPSASGSPTAPSSTASPVSAPSSPAAVSGSARPATGPRISGAGYSYRAPKGWRDFGSTLSAKGADSAAAALTPTHGFTSNVNVVIVDESFGRDQVDAVAERARDEVDAGSHTYKVLAPTTVAGSIAGHLGGPRTSSGATYWLEQYLISHGSHTYVVSFSFSPKVPGSERSKEIAEILASWTWA